ncbi:MAG: hypothetical protein PH343_02210 [Nitrospira sp.]|nr:hypothetical protein [Nitrospira sp.]
MNQDFAEMLSGLSAVKAEFIIVGAHALAAHGLPRATGGLDIWIKPSPENAEKVWEELNLFGAPLSGLSINDLSTPGIVFQIGLAPCRIDILTQIDGVNFDEAWANRIYVKVLGVDVPVIGANELTKNKKAVGRPQDIADAARLENNES